MKNKSILIVNLCCFYFITSCEKYTEKIQNFSISNRIFIKENKFVKKRPYIQLLKKVNLSSLNHDIIIEDIIPHQNGYFLWHRNKNIKTLSFIDKNYQIQDDIFSCDSCSYYYTKKIDTFSFYKNGTLVIYNVKTNKKTTKKMKLKHLVNEINSHCETKDYYIFISSNPYKYFSIVSIKKNDLTISNYKEKSLYLPIYFCSYNENQVILDTKTSTLYTFSPNNNKYIRSIHLNKKYGVIKIYKNSENTTVADMVYFPSKKDLLIIRNTSHIINNIGIDFFTSFFTGKNDDTLCIISEKTNIILFDIYKYNILNQNFLLIDSIKMPSDGSSFILFKFDKLFIVKNNFLLIYKVEIP